MEVNESILRDILRVLMLEFVLPELKKAVKEEVSFQLREQKRESWLKNQQ